MAKDAPGRRGRLRQKYLDYGLKKLTDAEILELLLTFGTPRRDCKQTARDMLEKFGALRDVFEADPKLLAEVNGAGPNNILAVKIINDIAGMFLERRLLERTFLFDSEQIMAYLRQSMENLPKEVFKVIFLDNSNVVISIDELSESTVTAAYIHTRTVLERAIKYNSIYENEVRETYKTQPLASGGLLHENNPVTYREIRRKPRPKSKNVLARVLEDEGRTVHES